MSVILRRFRVPIISRQQTLTKMDTTYPRNLVGYGINPPDPKWPNNARLAVQFVLNYEEGGENCILHGDAASEAFLSEIVGADTRIGVRHMSMESIYEYGTRAGVWRVLRIFQEYEVPLTIFAVGMAVERHPEVIEYMVKLGHEICSHGYRWIDYQYVEEQIEREHIGLAIEAIRSVTGERPLGWYTGRTSPNTRRLVVEEGGFVYDSDDYSDDLPFWDTQHNRAHLVIPYTLDANDMRFATAQGFNCGDQFFTYLKDAFDLLYSEGKHAPKMMSVGLHCRLIGRPGRAASIARFLEYITGFDDVWLCRRIEIATHWNQHFKRN